MEDFLKIKNPTIVNNPNALKTKKFTTDYALFDNGVYGKTKVLGFPKTIDELSMTFLKYEIETAGTVANGIIGYDKLAHNLMSNIQLKTKSGVDLMTVKPCYSRMVYKQLFGKPLYACIENSIRPDPSFYTAPTTSTTTTLYFPVPFFYSAQGGTFLNIRHLESIRLHLTMNNADDIGLKDATTKTNIVITSVNASIIQEAFNKELTQRDWFYNNSDISIQRALKNTFDVFYEDVIDIPANATSAKTLLLCNCPLMTITCMVYNNENEYQINSFSVDVKGNSILDAVPNKTNYAYYDENASYTQNKHLTYWFNKKNEILSNTGLTTFSEEDSMYPAYLTVNFDAPTADSKLYVFCEIITNHLVSEKGVISVNNTDSTLSTNNSMTIRV